MATCTVCGASMARFENPTRWVCPKESDHARIERDKRQRSGGNPKGNPGTLKRGGGKKKK